MHCISTCRHSYTSDHLISPLPAPSSASDAQQTTTLPTAVTLPSATQKEELAQMLAAARLRLVKKKPATENENVRTSYGGDGWTPPPETWTEAKFGKGTSGARVTSEGTVVPMIRIRPRYCRREGVEWGIPWLLGDAGACSACGGRLGHRVELPWPKWRGLMEPGIDVHRDSKYCNGAPFGLPCWLLSIVAL